MNADKCPCCGGVRPPQAPPYRTCRCAPRRAAEGLRFRRARPGTGPCPAWRRISLRPLPGSRHQLPAAAIAAGAPRAVLLAVAAIASHQGQHENLSRFLSLSLPCQKAPADDMELPARRFARARLHYELRWPWPWAGYASISTPIADPAVGSGAGGRRGGWLQAAAGEATRAHEHAGGRLDAFFLIWWQEFQLMRQA